MTAYLNKVQLIGNLGGEPKTISGKDGQSFVTVTLATNEAYRQNGELKNRVEWHQLIFFGNQVKVTEFLHKGSLVFIEGKLRTNSWTDKDGSARQTISTVVSNVQLLGQPRDQEGKSANATAESHMAKMREILQESSEDIPF